MMRALLGILLFCGLAQDGLAQPQTPLPWYSIAHVAGASVPATDGEAATQALLRWVDGVSVDRSGNILITEQNRIRKLTPDGKLFTLAGIGGRYGWVGTPAPGTGGPAANARLCFPSSAVADSAGNIYIGDGCNRVIRKIGTDGSISVAAGTGSSGSGWTGDGGPATAAQIGWPGALAFDKDGNLFFTDLENHVIRKIDRGGTISTVAGTGRAGFNGDGVQAKNTQLNTPRQICFDAAGRLYVADEWNSVVRRIESDGTMKIVAGNRNWGFSGDGGLAVLAALFIPAGVSVDSSGNVYIADTGNHRIRVVSPSGTITTVAGTGTAAFAGDDGLARNASLASPSGITFTAAGDLLIADWNNHRLRKFHLADASRLLTTVAGSANARGDGGPAAAAVLFSPRGIVMDRARNVYFADSENSRIRKIAPDGAISTVAGGIRSGFSGDGGPAASALLNRPWGITVDSRDNILFCDYLNHRIRKISPEGIITTIAGNGTFWEQLRDGSGAAGATVAWPRYITADTSGNVYVSTLNRVRKISGAGVITTIAGGDQAGFSGDGGLATAAQLKEPWGLAVDETGAVYIADRGNHAIRKISSGGVISTVAGAGGRSGSSGEGQPAAGALLNSPSMVFLDAAGNLLILDEGNRKIRRVATNGIINTVAGRGELGDSGNGDAAMLARFGWLRGGWLDGAGNILVTDEYYDVIRKLSPLVAARIAMAGGDGQSADAGKRLPAPLRVKVTDQAGIAAPGVAVEFAVISGDASLSVNRAVTAVTGEASVEVTLGKMHGLVRVKASAAGIGEVIFQATALEVVPPSPPKVTAYAISTVAGSYAAVEGGAAAVSLVESAAGVAADGGGNLYFAELDRNRVRKVSPDGVITTVAGDGIPGFSGDGGPAAAARLSSPSALAFDAKGNLYIADTANHRLRLVTPDGLIQTICGTGTAGSGGDGGPASRAQLSAPAGIAIGGDGSILVSETNGHRVRRIAPDGNISTFAGVGTAGFSGDGGPAARAQLRNPAGLAADPEGRVYIADRANHCIRRVSPAGDIETVAGTGTAGFLGDGNAAVEARLNNPYGVSLGPDGDFFIADTANNRVRRVLRDGVIWTVAGGGAAGYGGDGGPATRVTLYTPRSVAVDAEGNLYIGDLRTVRKVESSSNTISKVAGFGAPGLGDGEPAVSAALYHPEYALADAAGNIFIADSQNQRIRKVSPDGTISTIAGTGVAGFAGDGGPATEARFNYPTGLSLDAAGTLYVADSRNHRVRRINTDGTVETVAGNGQSGFGGDGGVALEARLNTPMGLAITASGNLLVSDTGNARVRMVDRAGMITTWAGSTAGFEGDGGDAKRARITPAYITADSAGNVYIADSRNNRVRKVTAAGIITTVAGTGAAGFSGDGGLAAEAQLNAPAGVAADAEGNLYVADGMNCRVRKISPSGVIVTIAGDGQPGPGGDGGSALEAQLSSLAAITLDAAGNVYVADRRGYRIRKLSPAVLVSERAVKPPRRAGK